MGKKDTGKKGSENEKKVKTVPIWRPVVVPVLALIAVGVLPGMLKGLYDPYTTKLIQVYVSFGLLFMGAIFGALSVMVFFDLSSRRQKIFRLAPSEQPTEEADGAVRVRIEEDRIEKR